MRGRAGFRVFGWRVRGSAWFGWSVRVLCAVVGVAVVATLLVVSPAAAAPAPLGHGHPGMGGRTRSVRVSSSGVAGGVPSLDPGPGSVAARSMSWPSDSSLDLDASASAVRSGRVSVGGLSVALSRPTGAGAAADVPARAVVRVAGHDLAQRAGVQGVLVALARSDRQTARGKVHLVVDYSSFGDAFGAGFGSRLRPVSMPTCVLATPQLPACQVQTPITGWSNDEVAHWGSPAV